MKKMLKSKLFWGVFITYLVFTFIRVIQHETWYDEARAWLIAAEFTPWQIFSRIMKSEGHFFVWYFLLIPFAKTHFFYPYSMLILNWIFCSAAIFLMWVFAPFNKWLKIAITFTYPFTAVYAILARCYAIGILLLYSLTLLDKDKLKRPYLYSTILFFAANTSVMAMLGSIVFAAMFFYDLIKEKCVKKITLVSIFAVLCAVSLYLQLRGANPVRTALPDMVIPLNWNFFTTFYSFPQMVNFVLLIIGLPIILFVLSKSKKALFFILSSYSLMLLLFNFLYYGMQWHHYFFYVYLLIASWFFFQEEAVSKKFKSALTIILILVTLPFCNSTLTSDALYASDTKVLAKKILAYDDAGVIIGSRALIQLFPYFKDYEKVNCYYPNSTIKVRYPIRASYFMTERLNYDVVLKLMDRHKDVYLYALEVKKQLEPFEVKYKGVKLKFVLVERLNYASYIFKVEKDK